MFSGYGEDTEENLVAQIEIEHDSTTTGIPDTMLVVGRFSREKYPKNPPRRHAYGGKMPKNRISNEGPALEKSKSMQLAPSGYCVSRHDAPVGVFP